MNWILKIAPKKLRNIDKNLRKNYPSVWATKIHLTTYLGLLLAILTGIIGAITPISTHEVLSQKDIETFFALLIIPAVIYTGYIIVQLLHFNIEKRYGITGYKTAWTSFSLIMVSLLIAFLMPFSNSLVLSFRVANLKNDKQIIHQRDQLAKTKYFINGGVSEYKYKPKKVLIPGYKDFDEPLNKNNYEYKDPLRDSIYRHEGIFKFTRPRLKKHYDTFYEGWELQGKSSLITLDSLTEIFYDQQNAFPNLDTAKYYLSTGQTIITEYSNHDAICVDSIIGELQNNIYSNTYSFRRKKGEYGYNYDYYPANTIYLNAHNNIYNIIQAKNNWIPQSLRNDFFPGLFTFMFCLSIVVFTFKLVSWKQFLINIFTTGLYFTIVVVLADIYRWKSDFVATMFLILMVISLTFMNRIWYQSKFSVLINQFAITAIYSTSFLPLFIFFYLKKVIDFFKSPYFEKYRITKLNHLGTPYETYSQEYYELMELIEFWCFWGGISFFVIIALPYFHRLFKRLNTLPTKK